MSISYNTQIVQDGLVLCLDAGNPRSYSPNVHPKPLDIASWALPGGAYQMTLTRDTSLTSPANGVPLKMVTAGTNSPYTGSYNSAAWNLAPAASGQTWTVSLWVKGTTAHQASVMIFGANSSGNYLETPTVTFNVTTEWTKVSGSVTLSNASTTHIQMRFDNYNNGVTWWVDGIQLERSSSATKFNPLTNTNNSSLFDVSRLRQTATLNSSPAYNTAGYLTFTGTQTITVPNPLTTQSAIAQQWTVSGWLDIDDTANQYLVSGLNQGIFPSYGANNSLLYLNSGVNDYYTYGGDIGALGWKYVTFRFDNVTGYRKIYSNGVDITTSGPNATSTPSGISSTWTIASNLRGKLAKLEVYDRVLNDSEVLQNFAAGRGKFGV